MARRWWLAGVVLTLAGCGIPYSTGKSPSSDLETTSAAVVSGLGDGAFALRYTQPLPVLVTTPQDGVPRGDTARGVAGAVSLGDTFRLRLPSGSGAQIVVVGPVRSDPVLTFVIGSSLQRVDSDPLSPDLTVESFTITAGQTVNLEVRVRDYNDTPSSGLARWYAWPLSSSNGQMTSSSDTAGPADVTTLPGSFEFDATHRGDRLEVLVLSPSGSDPVLGVKVGGKTQEVDADVAMPRRNLEAFTLRVDDPVHVKVNVDNFDGDMIPGDVRWAVIRLPQEESRGATGGPE